MEAGGGNEDDTDIAQLWEELPELANAREATAAFTFDPTAQYVEDEPDMKWACEITAMRLLKKAKKEHLIPLLEDFGVPTKGSKEELCTLLSEQVHYETDSGDDDE